MRKSGQVTVFLSMVLLCMCALLCSIVESARMAGARLYLRTAAESALDSVMAGYHREVWDSYRLFLREFGQEKELEEEFSRYFKTYFETGGWYPADQEEIKVNQTIRIHEDKGYYLEQEILDYMKFGVWTIDFSPQETGDLKEKMKEAQAVGRSSGIYSGHTKEALQVEAALEELDKSLEKQKEKKKQGIDALSKGDGDGFQTVGNGLVRELERIPKLVENYEKKADRLEKKLNESKARFMKEQGDMGEEAIKLLGEEISQYESYIAKDGERREEIAGEIQTAEENKRLTVAVMEEAIEVEEYIENWEGDDEDDELDEEALWEPVRRHFENFQEGIITCPHGVQDQEKKNILENLKGMIDKGVLDMVVPEGKTVSETNIQSDHFPSVLSGNGQQGTRPEGTRPEGIGSRGIGDVLLINEYCGKFFPSFVDEGDRKVQYELEYLAEGELSDRANLSQTAEEIFLIREGLNLLHILSDGQKREAARNLAAAIVGASGIAPLVLVTAFLIMTLWAGAEAVYDLRLLLSGGKVPLWKSSGEWKLGLDQMMDMGRKNSKEEYGENSRGLAYAGYVKLLLFMKDRSVVDYRIMDMIQVNIQEKQADFSIMDCAYGVDIEADICGKHIFFLPGIVENPFGDRNYPMSIRVRKAY